MARIVAAVNVFVTLPMVSGSPTLIQAPFACQPSAPDHWRPSAARTEIDMPGAMLCWRASRSAAHSSACSATSTSVAKTSVCTGWAGAPAAAAGGEPTVSWAVRAATIATANRARRGAGNLREDTGGQHSGGVRMKLTAGTAHSGSDRSPLGTAADVSMASASLHVLRYMHMRRTSILLDPGLLAELERIARRQG